MVGMRGILSPRYFLNDNTDLHNLIRKRLILPCLNGSFHPSSIEEYAGGLLMALQKLWRHLPHPLRRGTAPLLRKSLSECDACPQ
jgi:hypothetical protein